MAANSFLLLTVLLFIFIQHYQVSALKCFTCTVTIGDIDQRCVTNPSAVQSGQPFVNCNYEYCTSKRVEYKDPPNTVHSMHRGCDSDPEQMNTIIEDDQFITYYRACRTDLCNSGSGKGGDGGVGLDPETGNPSVILAKGNNGADAGHHLHLGVVLTVGMVIAGMVLW